MASKSRLQKKQPTDYSPYIKHSPLLMLTLVSFFWIINIITTKDPSQIANYIIPQLYLQIIVPFFIFMSSLFGYLTLNIRRGGVIAFFTSLLLLFRLQQIQFEAWWLTPLFIIFAVLILLSRKTKKKSKREIVQEEEKE